MQVTPTEQTVKAILERAGLKVIKGSYPDFLVYSEAKTFCFVEVKSRRSEKPSQNQRATFEILKKLGIKCHVLHAESIKEVLDCEQVLASMQLPSITKVLRDLNRATVASDDDFLIQKDDDGEIFDNCEYCSLAFQKWDHEKVGIDLKDLSSDKLTEIYSSLADCLTEKYVDLQFHDARAIRSHMMSNMERYIEYWEKNILPKVYRLPEKEEEEE